MTLTKGFIQRAATTPLDARLMDAARFTHNADGSVRTGVLYNPQPTGTVVFGRSTMAVAIPSETAFVVSRGVGDGAVILYNSGVLTASVAAAPSANSRIDAAYVKHNDDTLGDADASPVFGVVTGVASASPTVPAVPTGALLLATITVPTGAVNTQSSGVVITTVAPFTSLAGAPIRYASQAAVAADASNATEGSLAYIGGSGSAGPLFYRRNSTWQRISSAFGFGKSSANTTVNSGTATTLTIGSFTVSDPTLLTAATNGLTVTVGGLYRITGAAIWDSNATGYRALQILVNNTVGTNPGTSGMAVNGFATYQTASAEVQLNANDTVTLRGTQNSGGPLTTSAQLTVQYIG